MNIQEIDKAFEKLLLNFSISIFYFPYQDEKNEYMEMLKLIVEQKIEYDKSEDFNALSIDILDDVHKRSLPLLEKYAIKDGNYIEQIEIWSDYLLNIRKKLELIKEEK